MTVVEEKEGGEEGRRGGRKGGRRGGRRGGRKGEEGRERRGGRKGEEGREEGRGGRLEKRMGGEQDKGREVVATRFKLEFRYFSMTVLISSFPLPTQASTPSSHLHFLKPALRQVYIKIHQQKLVTFVSTLTLSHVSLVSTALLYSVQFS